MKNAADKLPDTAETLTTTRKIANLRQYYLSHGDLLRAHILDAAENSMDAIPSAVKLMLPDVDVMMKEAMSFLIPQIQEMYLANDCLMALMMDMAAQNESQQRSITWLVDRVSNHKAIIDDLNERTAANDRG